MKMSDRGVPIIDQCIRLFFNQGDQHRQEMLCVSHYSILQSNLIDTHFQVLNNYLTFRKKKSKVIFL